MPFSDDDLLPISALQHFMFCERQCALIHLEQAWEDNVLTAKGKVVHERAHGGTTELRGNVLTVRSLRLRSLTLGLTGQADVVEFHRTEFEGALLPGRKGRWCPFPVEYKRGRPKRDLCDLVQLCAQALCLEEMLQVNIPAGAMFYGETKHRLDVTFDEDLRATTTGLADRLRAMLSSGVTPPAVYGKHCKSCSLINICQPKRTQADGRRDVRQWLARQLASEHQGGAP